MKLSKPLTDYLKIEGFDKLYPSQTACIDAGLLDGTSLMVSTPTASGKTLIAILAMINYLSKNGGKVVYLSPLRALAAEKYAEFKKLEKLNIGRDIKVSISTGDFDGVGKNLGKSDVLILTNERMDSIIRHNVNWIDDIGLVIADEIHLIGDEVRGPTLEMILTQLKLLQNKPQILALSATVRNAKAIANWLGCKLVKSNWRPVKLTEGVTTKGTVIMNDDTTFVFNHTTRGPEVDLSVQSISEGGQSLVFANTRSRAKQFAIKAANTITPYLTKREVTALAKASEKILTTNEHTESIKLLADLIRKGVSFHHAGLNQNCRQIVEKAFRDGIIKFLSSTPTLAAGVNLPARRVIISSVSRYNANVGYNQPISVLEYKQLCGRAGRPQFDDYGQAIIVGKGNTKELVEHYINGTIEPITSGIMDETSLRTHTLSAIVTHPNITKNDLLNFFMQTFGGKESSKLIVELGIDTSLKFLLHADMIIEKENHYTATKFGQKTSKLYIDPRTAFYFRTKLESIHKIRDYTLGFLDLITSCDEFFPKFYRRSDDYDVEISLLDKHRKELLDNTSEFSRSLFVLHYWMYEYSESYISENFKIESGDLHRLIESGDRFTYCLREIAKHVRKSDLLDNLETMRLRIIYGIRAELLDLVRVRGIGRIRARALYKHKIKNTKDLRKLSIKKLAEIGKIGLVRAQKIKFEVDKIKY